MADNFGLKIGVEGEKEFKKALSDINSSMKVLGSEMKLVDSTFDKQDKSVAALTARNEVLNKNIEAQKQKVETLRSALENASTSFGENDRRTQAWQIQLNNAEAALNGMERELKQNNEGPALRPPPHGGKHAGERGNNPAHLAGGGVVPRNGGKCAVSRKTRPRRFASLPRLRDPPSRHGAGPESGGREEGS